MTSLGRMVSPSADFFGDSQATISQARYHGPYFSPVPEEEEQPQPGAPPQQAGVPAQARGKGGGKGPDQWRLFPATEEVASALKPFKFLPAEIYAYVAKIGIEA